MAKHRISRANTVFQGGLYNDQLYADNGGSSGVPVYLLTKIDLGAPDVADPDGVAEAQAVAGAGNLTLDGTLVSGGVATLDVPRAVAVDSSNSGDTTQTATVTGTDVYGNAMVETIAFNGTTAVSGQKAFKTVTQIAISAALTGNANVGTTDILGLPYKISAISDVVAVMADGVDEQASATVVAADTTSPATATTNDVRGTVTPNTATDGSVAFVVWAYIADKNSLGVTQYSG